MRIKCVIHLIHFCSSDNLECADTFVLVNKYLDLKSESEIQRESFMNDIEQFISHNNANLDIKSEVSLNIKQSIYYFITFITFVP